MEYHLVRENLKNMTAVERENLREEIIDKAKRRYLEKTNFYWCDWVDEDELYIAQKIDFLNGEDDFDPDNPEGD